MKPRRRRNHYLSPIYEGHKYEKRIFSENHTKQFQVHFDLLTAEILYMILNYYIRHHLTQEALEDFLRMMNIISGTKTFPESFKTFSSLFDAYSCPPVRIYFFSNCQYDYGANQPETAAICPIYPSTFFFTLNNLPPAIRFQKSNLMVAGLWLSNGEPNPNLLFKYFCLELRKLQEGKLIGGERYKVVLLQNCLDSVVRCKVQCSKQFNGLYGCTLCVHPGETRSTHNGHKASEMRYNHSKNYG
ncbi:uncharacterized protein LOC135698043 [Ochlerotatus camptorhynchus]|uniref:uncharacterized protein LOC135698043 n=1 Tax=Ochlerotatus camptorhynchus TaxID=644619 RepID=UPI0031DCD175